MNKIPDVKEILNLMKDYNDDDKKLIVKSYHYAEKLHSKQLRESGDPYFIHPVETAKTLADLGMSPAVVCAGLLHDIIEDYNVDKDEFIKEFGKEIFYLVEGVTKLGKLKYRGLQRHTESLRKFFIASARDIRVLIIRLADRLHNMETLQYLPPEKQVRKSTEVMEIFAPLAYRLGMRNIHKQLEDIAFSFLQPKEYKEMQQLLKQRKNRDMDYLEKFNKSLKKILAKENLINVKTSYRIKGLYSLYKKMARKNWDIDNIYDITALRIITESVADCYRVLGIIHSTWKPLPGRLKDYIALPKINGYKSIHTTIFTGDGGILEIQIRTQEMHDEAEHGIASHLSYKTGQKNQGEPWTQKLLSKIDYLQKTATRQRRQFDRDKNTPEWLKTIGDECTNGNHDGEELIENLKTDFFEHRVFVFTPTGDVIDLPKDSSPVDFAYTIHTHIGNHTVGAKVNNKMVSLDTKLKNGDIVEIITKKNITPTRKWLDFVKTSEAKKNIRLTIQGSSK